MLGKDNAPEIKATVTVGYTTPKSKREKEKIYKAKNLIYNEMTPDVLTIVTAGGNTVEISKGSIDKITIEVPEPIEDIGYRMTRDTIKLRLATWDKGFKWIEPNDDKDTSNSTDSEALSPTSSTPPGEEGKEENKTWNIKRVY